jgi:membrane-associated phospholipid phosphatase
MAWRTLPLCLVILVLLMASSAWEEERNNPKATDDFPSDVASAWFDLLYDVVKGEQSSPPVASRIYGIAAVALYEAVVPGSLMHRSLVQQLNELAWVPRPKPFRAYHWPTVANSAFAHAARSLFPTASQASLDAINDLEQTFATTFAPGVRPVVYDRSIEYGQAVANAVLAWAARDGYTTLHNCPYTPPVGPGLWEPTPPSFTPSPLQPCWGQLRPFVLTSGDACAPPTSPTYSSAPTSVFYGNALAVYNTNLNLTDEQTTIALYWADNPGATGTPPGHWIAIIGQIARHHDLSLMAAAEAYARVGLAVADAFISCWQTKYTYNLLRPVTYIQAVIDPDWLPLLVTPSFPSYSSGHSTQSGAVATVLTDLFGAIAFTDTLFADHGLMPSQAPRTFTSFDDAAEEAALSRLYAGIHYPFDNNNGLAQGRCIGQIILERIGFQQQKEYHHAATRLPHGP